MTLLAAIALLIPCVAAGTAPTPSPASAAVTPSPPAPDNPDPWAKLCDPGMKWELEPLPAGKRTKKSGHEWPIIRIENADQRMVGDVKVCRLRWFVVQEGKKPVDFDSKKIDEVTRGMLDTPSWEAAQWPMKQARWIAIAPDGLAVLSERGTVAPTEVSIGKQLQRRGPTFPGRASSPDHVARFQKGGKARWRFLADGRQVWCYGHRDMACTAEDSTCHAAACFENGAGLVALYVDSGARKFPDDFTFYSAITFPDYASWKPDAKKLDW